MKTFCLLLIFGSALAKKYNPFEHNIYNKNGIKHNSAKDFLKSLKSYKNLYNVKNLAAGGPEPFFVKYEPQEIFVQTHEDKIDVEKYVQEALNTPFATDNRINAPTDSTSPTAAAALAYLSKVNKDEFCGMSTEAYLKAIMAGKTKEEANAEATRVYINAYNNGASIPTSGACSAAEKAWRQAWANGEDPVLSSAMAFMENWHGVKEGNPCAVSGVDYVKAIIDGKSHLEANQIASMRFADAVKELAMSGKELKDKACRDSTLAFFNSVQKKPDPANAAAFTAFMEKIYQGGADVYDPVCFASLEGYMDAYMKGEDIMASNMAAGKTFFQSFMKGSDYPADSPCAAASLAYVKELAKKPSNPNAAAMVSYITEAIENKERKLDPVCAAATLAYFDAYMQHKSEDKATEAAAIAYLETVDQHPDFAQTSACAKAAESYIKNF